MNPGDKQPIHFNRWQDIPNSLGTCSASLNRPIPILIGA